MDPTEGTGMVLSMRDKELTNFPMEVGDVQQILEECGEPLLQVLDLSNNRIRCIGDGRLSLLAESLQHLSMGCNRLEELPDDVGELGLLLTLACSSNRLTRLPASLGHLTKLQYLSLASNQLESLPDELGRCSSLVSLDVSHNLISVLPPALAQLHLLRELNVAHNRLAWLPEELFAYDSSVAKAVLSGAAQAEEMDGDSHGLVSLLSLNLSHNNLHSLPRSLCRNVTLTNLRLHGNEELPLPHVGDLTYAYLLDQPMQETMTGSDGLAKQVNRRSVVASRRATSQAEVASLLQAVSAICRGRATKSAVLQD